MGLGVLPGLRSGLHRRGACWFSLVGVGFGGGLDGFGFWRGRWFLLVQWSDLDQFPVTSVSRFRVRLPLSGYLVIDHFDDGVGLAVPGSSQSSRLELSDVHLVPYFHFHYFCLLPLVKSLLVLLSHLLVSPPGSVVVSPLDLFDGPW